MRINAFTPIAKFAAPAIANITVVRSVLRNWEKGREEPRLHIWQVKALCKLLQCSLDDLPDRLKAEE